MLECFRLNKGSSAWNILGRADKGQGAEQMITRLCHPYLCLQG